MLNLTVNDFLKQLASAAPAPGGGSASALTGALAAALVNMVANLTQGKEKFAADEEYMSQLIQAAAVVRRQLAELMEEDTLAFQQVMAAFKLPRETAAEKEHRQARIQATMIHAAQVPLKTAETALRVLELSQIAAEKGNPSAVSDAGVAALLAQAAVEGAALNVKINLGSIKDQAAKSDLAEHIDQIAQTARCLANDVLAAVENKIDGQ
ncbi:MAG TPA: cyclodeaminase/cyclohydrolase family protein [Firmicutes bacterium]|nr:cyclodeaminase/cyclohydrolase family protein [Bacillota bacterium]